MILEALGNLGDFIGGIAVVLTLIYLAIQVRVNTSLIRASTLASASSTMVAFNHLLGSDPKVARVFQVGLEDFPSLSNDEMRQFMNLLRAAITAHEHVFHQHQRGMIDEEVWQKNLEIAGDLLSSPHVAVWWTTRRHIFAPAFARALDEAPRRAVPVLASSVIDQMVAASQTSPGSAL